MGATDNQKSMDNLLNKKNKKNTNIWQTRMEISTHIDMNSLSIIVLK